MVKKNKKNRSKGDGSDPPRAVGGLTIIDTTTKKDKTIPDGAAPPVDDHQAPQSRSSTGPWNNSRRSGNQEGSYQKDTVWARKNQERGGRSGGYPRGNYQNEPGRPGNQEENRDSRQTVSTWGPRNQERDRNSEYPRGNYQNNASRPGNQEETKKGGDFRQTDSTWGPSNQERGRNSGYNARDNHEHYPSRSENKAGSRSRERGGDSRSDAAWPPANQERDTSRGYTPRDNQQSDPGWPENKEEPRGGERGADSRQTDGGAWESGHQDRNKSRGYRPRDNQSDPSWSGNKEEPRGGDSRQTDWGSGNQERDTSRGYNSRDNHQSNSSWSENKKDRREWRGDSRQTGGRGGDDGPHPKSNSDYSKFPGSNRNNDYGDKEFDEFWKYFKSSRERTYVKVQEIEADLFGMSKEHSLAHCVAEDMAMGSGIAVQFSRDFKRRDELLQQREKQGGLAILEVEERYIYYLVTKRLSTGKPTNHTLWCSLQKMHAHIEEHKVTKLAMPRIGCGLDRLDWSVVKAMVEYIFRNTEIEITVCNFQQPEDGSSPAPPRSSKCAVRNVKYPLVQIDKFTAIVYFGSEDGFVTEEIQSLDTKFKVVQDYKTATRKVGEVVRSVRLQNTFILYGFIVRKSHEDQFDFTNLQKCIASFKKMNTKESASEYVGIEAFTDDADDLIMTKVVNVLRHSLYGVEIYVCWPGKMALLMPQERGENYSY